MQLLSPHFANTPTISAPTVSLVFGSTARDQARPDSDVDLLADFAPELDLDLLILSRLQIKLRRILEIDVDLSSEPWLRDRVRLNALADALLIV